MYLWLLECLKHLDLDAARPLAAAAVSGRLRVVTIFACCRCLWQALGKRCVPVV